MSEIERNVMIIERIAVARGELNRYSGKGAGERRGNAEKPFDVETTFAEAALIKKNREKKYRGPDSPLYSAIYPLVCIMRVFGLAPYDFTADRMTPSNVCIIFSFVFMTIYSYIMYIVFMRFITMTRQKPVLSAVETTKVIVNFLVAMYELISTVFTRRRFVRIWNTLQDYDERLNKLGYPRKEHGVEIAAWFLLISQTLIWVLINQTGMYAFQENWLFNVNYMCTYVGTSMSVYKFYGMVSFFAQRFRQLNEIAWENMPPRIGYKSSSVSRKIFRLLGRFSFAVRVYDPIFEGYLGDKLNYVNVSSRKTIQDLYNELMSSAEALNSLYSWSLLFWLANLSVHSVSNLYFIIDWVFMTPWSSIAWPLIYNMNSWLVGFITQLLVLHVGCDRASTEANSMGAILTEWDGRVIRRFPCDDTVLTSLQFLNRRLRFTAGGIFDVNLPFLCSIVGVLTTYMIILLQFPA